MIRTILNSGYVSKCFGKNRLKCKKLWYIFEIEKPCVSVILRGKLSFLFLLFVLLSYFILFFLSTCLVKIIYSMFHGHIRLISHIKSAFSQRLYIQRFLVKWRNHYEKYIMLVRIEDTCSFGQLPRHLWNCRS